MRREWLGLQSILPLQKWNSSTPSISMYWMVVSHDKIPTYFITYYGEEENVYEWFGIIVIIFYDMRAFFKSSCWSCVVCLLSLVEGPPCDEKSSIVKDNWSKKFYVLTRQRMKGCHQNSRNPALWWPNHAIAIFPQQTDKTLLRVTTNA